MIDRGTILVLPRNCALSASSTLGATSASNMLIDEPALVHRWQGTAGAYLNIEQNGLWDVLALVGVNCPGTTQVRIRAAESLAAVTAGPALDQTIAAYTGVPKATGATVLFRLEAPVSYAFVRVDFINADNPDGYLEVSNLVLGSAVEWSGVDIGAEITYSNQGASYLRKYRTKPTWKFKLSGISKVAYYDQFDDFLMKASERSGLLFVPSYNDPYMQKLVRYVSIAAEPKTTINSSNDYTVEFEVSTIQ